MEKKWTDEDQKRFVKGLRQCGKNFFKIRKELLPQKETSELVEFYYLWKKSPQAVSTRYHRRHRRQTVLRRAKTPPVTAAPNQLANKPCLAMNENNDLSSASDDEESDDSDTNAFSCSHCAVTTSKDWQRGGKDNGLVCTECRVFWKKTGEMRPLTESPFLFKPVSDEDAVKHTMRTRRSRDPSSKTKSGSKSDLSPERADHKNGSKSPVDQKIGTKRSLAPAQSPKLKRRKEEEKPDDDSSEKTADDSLAEDKENESQKNGQEDGDSVQSECSKSQDSTPPPDSASEPEKMDTAPPAPSPVPDEQPRPADLSVKREDSSTAEEPLVPEVAAAATVAEDVPTPSPAAASTTPGDQRADAEAALPPCPPLITPKTEPPASPPALASDHHHRNPHLVHPAAQHATPDLLPPHRADDRSPVRIKEESGVAVGIRSPAPAGHRISSPSRRTERSSPEPVRHSFPFAGSHSFSPGRRSSPLSFAPARDLQDRERELQRDRERERDRDRDRDRERERRPSSESRSRTPREKSDESPRPPVISSFLSQYPGLPQMMPPHSRHQELPPTTMYSMMSSLSPAEQRFPPGAMGHPGFPPHLMAPHPGLGPPSYAFMPPGMPPYFASHWYPPRHMAFPPAVPSPSSAPPSIKPAKSPVTQNHPAPAAPFQPHLMFQSPKESDHREHRSSDRADRRDPAPPDDDDQDLQPNIVRGPSPEPKVDDSEFHRSQAAMYAFAACASDSNPSFLFRDAVSSNTGIGETSTRVRGQISPLNQCPIPHWPGSGRKEPEKRLTKSEKSKRHALSTFLLFHGC